MVVSLLRDNVEYRSTPLVVRGSLNSPIQNLQKNTDLTHHADSNPMKKGETGVFARECVSAKSSNAGGVFLFLNRFVGHIICSLGNGESYTERDRQSPLPEAPSSTRMVSPPGKALHDCQNHQLKLANRYHIRGWKRYLQSDFDGSVMDWRKALRIRQSLLGKDHSSTNESLDLIGCALHRKQWESKERRKYLKALSASIGHETNGDEYMRLEQYEFALREYQKSLYIEEAAIGRWHPVVATLYRKMACTLRHLGQLDKSTLVHCDALR